MVSNNLEVDMITSLSGEVYEKGELLDKIEAPFKTIQPQNLYNNAGHNKQFWSPAHI